jgi:hypothetical protein
MARVFSVKLLLVLFLALSSGAWAADDKPEAQALLKAARVAQSDMNFKFTGQLRNVSGSKKIPFLLTIAKGATTYEFLDTGDSITLRLGEKDSKLEEKVGGKTQKVTPAKFDDLVRDTNVTYEDLGLRFLYWPDAKVVDDDVVAARPSWKVIMTPPAGAKSQYAKVEAWFAKADNALMRMEAFDPAGKRVRKYIVRSFMKRDNFWFLQQLEISSGSGSKNMTYLELQDVVK